MAVIKSIKAGEITYDLKATYDGSGNNIVETYAKSSTIPTKVSLLLNDKNYLTKHLDISGLATQELVDKKVDKELGKGLSEANYTKSEKQKLEGVETGANKYVHPTSDGNLHVPATGTTNNGKVLKAGATAGSLIWGTDNDTITTINGKTGVITKADIVALGIPAQDTVYTHPTKHPASIITQDASNRFVTDAEKSTWNAKETIEGAQTKADGALSSAKDYTDGKVLTDVPEDALFTDTIYTHPKTHPASMIIETDDKRFVSDTERTVWNAKETTDGAQTKATNALTSAKTYVDGKVKTDVPLNAKFTDTVYTHPAGTNPHGTTKADVGLGNVDNTSDADKPVSTAQAAAINAKYTKPALGIPKTDLVTAVQTSLGKADTALQSFTETDPTVPSWAKQTNKPTYTAKEVGAISFSEKGANNGVAELDSSGKVLSSQLPSYVDDVLEYATLANFPTTGETGKIYIAINTNLTYRWTGTTYTEISPSMALGETSATAYRGDRGKIAYDHSQTAHAPSTAQKNSDITKAEIEAKLIGAITSHTHAYASTSHAHNASDINAGTLAIARIPTGTTASTVSLGNHTHSNYVPTSRTVAGKALTANITLAKGDVGLGSVDNTSDANKPVSTAQQTALNAKMDSSKFQVVESLPASPVSGTFYFVKE